MAEELSLIEEFIYSRLSGDSTLTNLLGTQPSSISGPGIFPSRAPKDAVFPVVIFKWIPGGKGDYYANGNNRVWSNAWYQITAMDERTDYEGLAPIASRVDELLGITNAVPVTDGIVLQSIRLDPYKGAIYEGANQEFRELGAFWDIIAQAV